MIQDGCQILLWPGEYKRSEEAKAIGIRGAATSLPMRPMEVMPRRPNSNLETFLLEDFA
jgi:hypothetical protein